MPKFEYDKDYPFAAFITNLGKYNEGELVGEWVKFPTTAEELQAVFKRIGIGEKDDFGYEYEEWFITDYDCYVDGLYDKLGEYANLDELNYLASRLDEMYPYDYERFCAAVSMGDHTNTIQDLINLTENLDCYEVYSDIEDAADLGRYYLEELEVVPIPDHLRGYIDYEAYGRDCHINEGGEFTDYGYVRDTGNSFHEYYDGDRDNIPEEYRVMNFETETELSDEVQLPEQPDNYLTGESVQTPRGSFHLTSLSKEQMEAAGYGVHHNSDDGRYHIMGNGTRAFAVVNEEFHEREQQTTAKELAVDIDRLCREHIQGYVHTFPRADYQQEIIAARIMEGETYLFKTQLLNFMQPEATADTIRRLDDFEKDRGIGTYMVYQLKHTDENHLLRFEALDRLYAAGKTVDPSNYELVYAGPFTPGETLETIYRDLNVNHPEDYRGHSLSVSDVVVLREYGKDTAHYCDSIGFAELPQFLNPQQTQERDNPLRTAEMTIEDDYGMIDGIINNGRRDEPQGKISIRERLVAAKKEIAQQKTPEGKRSGRDVPEQGEL